MKPCEEAQAAAVAALGRLQDTTSPKLAITHRIAQGEQLTGGDVDELRRFYTVDRGDVGFLIAYQLRGGEALEHQIAATPPPLPKATVVAVVDTGTAVHHAPLVELGDTPALGELARLSAIDALESLTEATFTASSGKDWRYARLQQRTAAALAHSGPAPDLDPPPGAVTHLRLLWGQEQSTFPLTQPVTVTAAGRAAERHAAQVQSELIELDRVWTNQINALVQHAFQSMLDRVGRKVTQVTKNETFRMMAAAEVALLITAQADDALLREINAAGLIQPALDDLVASFRRLTREHVAQINDLIERRYGVAAAAQPTIPNLDQSAALIEERVRTEVLYVVTTPAGGNDIETLEELTAANPRIARDATAVAAGAGVEVDENGHSRAVLIGGLIALGTRRAAVGMAGTLGAALVNEAVTARREGSQQYRVLSGGQIGDSQETTDQTVQAAVDREPLLPETRFIWTPNWHGVPVSGKHHPDHEGFFGDIATETQVAQYSRHPGDHPRCKCEWVPQRPRF